MLNAAQRPSRAKVLRVFVSLCLCGEARRHRRRNRGQQAGQLTPFSVVIVVVVVVVVLRDFVSLW